MFSYATPHTVPLCSKSSYILSSLSKELEPLTSHYTTKALSSPAHTHTHTHTHVIKHCVYRRGNREKIYSFLNIGKSVKAIKNKTAPQ